MSSGSVPLFSSPLLPLSRFTSSAAACGAARVPTTFPLRSSSPQPLADCPRAPWESAGDTSIPALVALGVNIHETLGASLLSRGLMSLSGALGHVHDLNGEILGLAMLLSITAAAGTMLGVSLSRRISSEHLGGVVHGWLALLAGRMLMWG